MSVKTVRGGVPFEVPTMKYLGIRDSSLTSSIELFEKSDVPYQIGITAKYNTDYTKNILTIDKTTGACSSDVFTLAGAMVSNIPIASASVLGGIKVGPNLTVDATGVLSGKDSYLKSETYTKAESDGRFEPLDSAYTKSESDYRYAPINKVEGQVFILTTEHLDTIRSETGQYRQPVSTGDMISLGYPVNKTGYLEVMYIGTGADPAGTIQRYTVGGTGKIYERVYSANAWIPWKEVPLGAATDYNLGAVKVALDSDISVDAAGFIDVKDTSKYVLPVASATVLGGVKQGNNITIDATGTISGKDSYLKSETYSKVESDANFLTQAEGDGRYKPIGYNYVLPVATSTVLGGVKQGSNITIDAAGVISAPAPTAPYTLPIATASVLGGIKVGANLTIDAGGILAGKDSYLKSETYSKTEADTNFLTQVEGDALYKPIGYNYTLPIASSTVLGGVKVGANLTIDANGVLNGEDSYLKTETYSKTEADTNFLTPAEGDGRYKPISYAYTLPVATTSVLGGVKQGSNITIDAAGVISAPAPTAPYTLPIASATVLGGFKVGANLTIDAAGVLSGEDSYLKTETYSKTESDARFEPLDSAYTKAEADARYKPIAYAYTLPVATATVLGGVKQGSNITIDAAGVISAPAPTAPYTLPIATASVLGGIKVGANLTIDAGGILTGKDTYLKSETYSKTEADTNFLTTAEANALYEPINTMYTKAESDARYEPIDSAYTKAESDGRYEPIDSAYTKAESDGKYVPDTGSTGLTGIYRSTGEFQTVSVNGFRMVNGNYGAFWHQNGTGMYLMTTASGDQYGSYTTLRPFMANLTNGAINLANDKVLIDAAGSTTISGTTTFKNQLLLGYTNVTSWIGARDNPYLKPTVALADASASTLMTWKGSAQTLGIACLINQNIGFYRWANDRSANGTDASFYMDISGNCIATGNITAYSDMRLKKNIVKLENATDIISQLNGYRYDHIKDERTNIGVIAQEVEAVLPELITISEEDGMKSVAYGNLTAVLIEALKETNTKLEETNTKLTEANTRIAKLEFLVNELISKKG